MRAVHMAVMIVAMIMFMIVVAVGAMDVGLLGHARSLRNEITGNYLAIACHVHAATEE